MSKIVQAAIRLDDGSIHTGKRHGEIIQHLIGREILNEKISQDKQGFVDEDGKWLSRQEAWDVAVEHDQLLEHAKKLSSGKLVSEMLW